MRFIIILCALTCIFTQNIKKSVQYLIKHAHARSQGYCAKYVANALKAGGFKFNPQPSAYMYHTKGIMRGMGFTQIQRGSPREGDVYVQDRTKSHIHGHIAMYTSKGWVSDFVQKSDQVYRSDAGKRYYYRFSS